VIRNGEYNFIESENEKKTLINEIELLKDGNKELVNSVR